METDHIQTAPVTYIHDQQPTAVQRLRGLKDLIVGGVEAGTDAVERTQRSITRVPYDILERITPIAAPVAAIRGVQESLTSGIYAAVRTVNRAAGAAAGLALDYIERREGV